MGKKIIKVNIEMISNSTKKAINELTRSEKNHRNTDIINAIKGKRTGINCIRTIAIFTAQNPDSQKVSNSINRRNNNSLIQDLKNGHYVYMPCMGRWEGNVENSFAIINIPLDVCKYFFGKYQQTSFIFSTLREDGTLYSQYYEKVNSNTPYDKANNDYIPKSEGMGYIDMNEDKDNFTIIGNKFKYQIPFNEIASINDTIAENFNKISSSNKQATILEEVDFCMNHIGMPTYIHKKNLYNGLI